MSKILYLINFVLKPMLIWHLNFWKKRREFRCTIHYSRNPWSGHGDHWWHLSCKLVSLRFHAPTIGQPLAQLLWMKNPGTTQSDGTGWAAWEQFVLVEGGPDVFLQIVSLEADGTTYDVLVAGNSRNFEAHFCYSCQLSFYWSTRPTQSHER